MLLLLSALLRGIEGRDDFYIGMWSAQGDPDGRGPGLWGWADDDDTPAQAYARPRKVVDLIRWVRNEDANGREAYHTPHYLTAPSREKASAGAPVRALWADADEAPAPKALPPSVVVQTSPSCTQQYWLLHEAMPPLEAQALNKCLTYAIGADRSGWPLCKLLRLPGTHNRKRGEPFEVKMVVYEPDRRYRVEEIERFVSAHEDHGSHQPAEGDGGSAETGQQAPSDSSQGGRQITIDFEIPDDAIIAIARTAKNGAKFNALFEDAGWEEMYLHGDGSRGDWSRAVMGLAAIIAFYTWDTDQIERIVALSRLCSDDQHAARWQRDAARVIAKVQERGR